MEVQRLRYLLPTTERCIYMNTGWVGPASSPVLGRIGETLEELARLGGASTTGLALARKAIEEARRAIGRLLGAGEDEVLLTHSTTEGVDIVLYGFPWQPGDGLLICDLEHPALTHPAQVLAARRGVEVTQAIVPTNGTTEDALMAVEAAITPKTKLAALSHIQYTCGFRMPIEAISAVLRRRGILLLVDGAQSVGQIAVDVKALGVDFYSHSGQKWLMGPEGTGGLYVSKERRDLLEPLFTTNALEEGRGSSRLPMARFNLTSHNPGLANGLTEAINLAMMIGLPAIEERSTNLGAQLARQADDIDGCQTVSARSHGTSSGLITQSVRGWPPAELVSALQERHGIIARAVNHPPGVRFSTSFFNTEAEVAAVAKALGELVAERA